MAKLGRPDFNLVTGGVIGKFLESNADGERTYPSALAFHDHGVVGVFAKAGGFRDDSLQAAQKVEAVTVGLKPHQMVMQQGTQNLPAPR